MSAVKESPAPRVASAPQQLRLPQVNLLPPEVKAARSLAVVKRWLGIGLVVVVGIIALAYVYAIGDRSRAETELREADQETADLRVEEAKYAQVPRVLGALDAATTARLLGAAPEIDWKPYVDAVTAVLPADVSIDSFTLSGPSPIAGSAGTATILGEPSIGSLSFAARSRTVPDIAAELDALASVPGFTDPWASAISVTQQEETVYYSVSYTVQLTDATLSHRFEASDEATTPAATDATEPTPAATEGTD